MALVSLTRRRKRRLTESCPSVSLWNLDTLDHVDRWNSWISA